jgi:hypothetical protein
MEKAKRSHVPLDEEEEEEDGLKNVEGREGCESTYRAETSEVVCHSSSVKRTATSFAKARLRTKTVPARFNDVLEVEDGDDEDGLVRDTLSMCTFACGEGNDAGICEVLGEGAIAYDLLSDSFDCVAAGKNLGNGNAPCDAVE